MLGSTLGVVSRDQNLGAFSRDQNLGAVSRDQNLGAVYFQNSVLPEGLIDFFEGCFSGHVHTTKSTETKKFHTPKLSKTQKHSHAQKFPPWKFHPTKIWAFSRDQNLVAVSRDQNLGAFLVTKIWGEFLVTKIWATKISECVFL